ncbi:MAG TPA: glycosyltransferase [Urbifossiella sp.]|nr:glycosyltransferase [Urbifossiella sp.]
MNDTSTPAWLWSAPVPVVALAADPNLLWHGYRAVLHLADLVLTDQPAVDRFHRAGIAHVRPANLYGLDREFLAEAGATHVDRDIDVLFVGNMNPAVQGGRLPWLGRVGRLAGRHRVVIATGLFEADYRALLRRAKMVFNKSIRGECNQRAFEAAATGAVLLQEAENPEVPLYLEPGTEYVPYTADDLEARVAACLADEAGRREMSARAGARVRGYGWLDLIRRALADCASDWPAVRERAARRSRSEARPSLPARVWQRAGLAGPDADAALVADLTRAGDHHALGLFAPVGSAEPHLARAAGSNRVSALGHAAALLELGRDTAAADAARRVLAALDGGGDLTAAERDTCPYPIRFDHLRVEWERAGWDHPDDPPAEVAAKTALLRCWASTILATVTGDLAAYAAVATARPDLPVVRAALGCALARAGRFSEAVDHLSAATAANPFDSAAAGALAEALADAGRPEAAAALRADRRLLARAAPGLVRDIEPESATPTVATAGTPVGVEPGKGPQLAVAWDGEFGSLLSLAGVNRAVCAELADRGHHLALIDHPGPVSTADGVPLPAVLRACCRPLPGPADVFVRHRYPEDLSPPGGGGAFVLMQPWEFGSVPRAWVDAILDRVDEVWAYSRAVEGAYVASGLPADRVAVVPLGVDVERFRPGLDPLPLATPKRVRLLFVGGTVWRNGFDVLLSAYRGAFTASDDVCLVVKDVGADSVHRGQTAEAAIAAFRADPDAPAVEYLPGDLAAADLPRLYAACDVLVLPSRGEEFGLPVLEAMACGLPVVVTAGGATDDFVPPAAGWRVASRVVTCPEERVGRYETADRPCHLEPDAADLARVLREAATDPAGRKARGGVGRRAAGGWTWARTAAAVEDRVRHLRGRTPIRFRHTGRTVSPTPVELTSHPLLVDGTAPHRRQRVSLCMIVRDEEHNLRDCLGPVAGLFDEMVVVDTGSTDRTREVARELGARVVEFPWCNSFAAARNESLRHATGDWAFWLDADDRVDADNRARLAELFASLRRETAGFVLKCACVSADPGGPVTVVDHVRLFRLHPLVRWTYRVHEQILPALRRVGADVRWVDVTVHHVGYTDAALRKQKLGRDLRLLRLEEAEQPDDPFTLFNLGQVLAETGDVRAALVALERSLALSHPADSIVRKLYALIAQGRRGLGERGAALAACRAGLEHYPDDAELRYTEADLLREAGDLAGAEASARSLVGGREGAHFASVDSALRGYKARHLLALVLLQQGRLSDAEAEWVAVLAEVPGFVPGLMGLAEVSVRRGDTAELARRLDELAGLGPAGWEAAEALRVRQREEPDDGLGAWDAVRCEE